MRRIGTLSDEALARRFVNYLLTQSVNAVFDASPDDKSWEIWIRNEDDMEVARAAFLQFEASPDEQKFSVNLEADRIRHERVDELWQRRQALAESVGTESPTVHAAAAEQSHQPSTEQPESGEPFSESNPLLDSEARQSGFPITIGIIVMSMIASFSCNFAQPRGSRIPGKVTVEEQVFNGLSFVDRREYQKSKDPFASISKGEIWRIVTPMFLHGNMFHLFFNMFLIFLLGSMIERIHGSWFFLFLVLATQTAGMMVQVLLPDAAFMPAALRGSPLAIGASGAGYGLFGFMWIRPWLDPDYPIELDSTQFMLMLGGLIVCMTPLVPNVANGAHLGGLAAGMLLAAIGYLIHR